jgi:hypothetical protein
MDLRFMVVRVNRGEGFEGGVRVWNICRKRLEIEKNVKPHNVEQASCLPSAEAGRMPAPHFGLFAFS